MLLGTYINGEDHYIIPRFFSNKDFQLDVFRGNMS